MSAEAKRGRPPKSKSWELLLRHTFRAGYLEDPDLHALMFVSGDNFTAILKKALKEFVENNNLPTSVPDFQSRLYVAASMHINRNREMPNSIDVLESINELSLVDKINELANQQSNIAHKPRKSTIAALQTQVERPRATVTAPPAQPVVTVPPPKPRLPLPEMDFGPEIDEDAMLAGQDTEVKKPPLKDRWLSRHNN